jgi:DNA polymerase-3 subunit epsilon
MLIVKPDGWEIPRGASDVHGITTEIANQCGVPLALALATFSNLVKTSDDHVAHNEEFDQRVLQAQFHRLNRPFPVVNAHCTKNLATPIVNLPPSERMRAAGFNKPKPPTLTECVDFFFGQKLEGAHDALVDTRACLRVYLEILRRQVQEAA